MIDASGAWAACSAPAAPRLRPLRGSHLVLPAWRLPLAQAMSLMHPVDGRPVFAFPWEGATWSAPPTSTTDGLVKEAAITRAELDYLMAPLHAQFPQLGLSKRDVLAAWAALRPLLATDPKLGPSQRSREHRIVARHGRDVHHRRRQADHLPR